MGNSSTVAEIDVCVSVLQASGSYLKAHNVGSNEHAHTLHQVSKSMDERRPNCEAALMGAAGGGRLITRGVGVRMKVPRLI